MAGDSGNIKNPNWYTGGLADAMAPGAGQVFYVNGGSDGPVVDTQDGLTPATPKQLLQSAIDLCTNDNNDYIIVLNYGGNARAVEAWPVEVNKSQIHIIGVGGIASKWPLVSVDEIAGANTAVPALLITADRVEIANVNLGGGNTAGAIHVGDGGGTWGTNVHDCFFGVEGTSQDGIRVPAAVAAPYLTVSNCRFDTGLIRDGIRLDANATRSRLGLPGRGNLFTNVPGVAINLNAAVTEPGIFDNVFGLPGDVEGSAITFHADVLDATVDGNSAGNGVDGGANNPYLDQAAGDANNWLVNYKGIAATYPA